MVLDTKRDSYSNNHRAVVEADQCLPASVLDRTMIPYSMCYIHVLPAGEQILINLTVGQIQTHSQHVCFRIAMTELRRGL